MNVTSLIDTIIVRVSGLCLRLEFGVRTSGLVGCIINHDNSEVNISETKGDLAVKLVRS